MLWRHSYLHIYTCLYTCFFVRMWFFVYLILKFSYIKLKKNERDIYCLTLYCIFMLTEYDYEMSSGKTKTKKKLSKFYRVSLFCPFFCFNYILKWFHWRQIYILYKIHYFKFSKCSMAFLWNWLNFIYWYWQV